MSSGLISHNYVGAHTDSNLADLVIFNISMKIRDRSTSSTSLKKRNRLTSVDLTPALTSPGQIMSQISDYAHRATGPIDTN